MLLVCMCLGMTKYQHVRDNGETCTPESSLESYRPVPRPQEWEEVGIIPSIKAPVRCSGSRKSYKDPRAQEYQVKGVACLTRVGVDPKEW